jgi:hypothetical protein
MIAPALNGPLIAAVTSVDSIKLPISGSAPLSKGTIKIPRSLLPIALPTIVALPTCNLTSAPSVDSSGTKSVFLIVAHPIALTLCVPFEFIHAPKSSKYADDSEMSRRTARTTEWGFHLHHPP